MAGVRVPDGIVSVIEGEGDGECNYSGNAYGNGTATDIIVKR